MSATRPSAGPRRGVALLVVLVATQLLAVMVLEFHESARSKLALAVNARDEVKAYYSARSGINLLRLALDFQYDLRNEEGIIGQAVDRSNFQLWQYLDLFLPTFVSARVDSPVGSLDLVETGAVGFGDLEGEPVFESPIPEEGKINLNGFSGNVIEQDILIDLCSLFTPTQYDALFAETDNEDTGRPTRGELIGAIIDYVDADSDRVIVDENCQIQSVGLGAEERRYEDLPYSSKNEPFTTLDEVLLVAGMTPDILEVFRDNLTVYAVAHEFYVNLADAQRFMGLLCANVLGAQEGINVCRSPAIATQLAYLALALDGWVRFFSSPFGLLDFYLGMSTGQSEARVAEGIAAGQMIAFRTEQDFLTVLNLFLQQPEVAAQYALLANPQQATLLGLMASGGQAALPRFSVSFDEAAIVTRISVDTPRVFTISASGVAGAARRRITAVADYNQEGRLLYWREY